MGCSSMSCSFFAWRGSCRRRNWFSNLLITNSWILPGRSFCVVVNKITKIRKLYDNFWSRYSFWNLFLIVNSAFFWFNVTYYRPVRGSNFVSHPGGSAPSSDDDIFLMCFIGWRRIRTSWKFLFKFYVFFWKYDIPIRYKFKCCNIEMVLERKVSPCTETFSSRTDEPIHT